MSPSSSLSFDRIDQELWRQGHKSEWEEQRNQRTAMVLEKDLPTGFEDDFNYMPEGLSPRQLKKDKLLARKDPATYCADRCVSTGNCEVFEDVFSLSPTDVMKFCTDCVLSEEEEPCDVPEAYLEDDQSYYKMMMP